MAVDQVIGYLEAEGHGVLKWSESVVRADHLREAALRGEAGRLGLGEAALPDIEICTND